MDQSAADVSQTVEYSMDKWLIDRVPWALWGCVAGLAIALHAESRGVNGAAVAVVYLALLGLAGAGFALTTLIERSGISFILELPIHLLIFIVVAFVIARRRRCPRRHSRQHKRLILSFAQLERVGQSADKCVRLDADLLRAGLDRLCDLPAHLSSAADRDAVPCGRFLPQAVAAEPVHSMAGCPRGGSNRDLRRPRGQAPPTRM